MVAFLYSEIYKTFDDMISKGWYYVWSHNTMNNEQTKYQVQKVFCEPEDFNTGTEASSLLRIVIIPANKRHIYKEFCGFLRVTVTKIFVCDPLKCKLTHATSTISPGAVFVNLKISVQKNSD